MFGTGVAPVMDAHTANFLYRTPVLCRQDTVRYFKVHNAGNYPLTIAKYDSTHTFIVGAGVTKSNFVDINGNLTTGASDYSIVYPNDLIFGLPHVIAPGATDSIGVMFKPTKEGDRIALLSLMSNAINEITPAGINSSDSIGIILQGIGLAPHVQLTVQNFGYVGQGDSATSQVWITNTGTWKLLFATQQLYEGNTDQFSIIRPFPPVIQPGDSGYMIVQFKPTTAVFDFVRIRLVTSAITTDSVKIFEMQGIGRPVARATYSPKTLFAKDTGEVGGAAVYDSVYVTNTGSNDLSITGITFGGTDAANYQAADQAPITVAKNGGARWLR
ncbi:MAG: choice-of-anchor D domain-containing protein, partial [Gammaproteobacteria bacterium]